MDDDADRAGTITKKLLAIRLLRGIVAGTADVDAQASDEHGQGGTFATWFGGARAGAIGKGHMREVYPLARGDNDPEDNAGDLNPNNFDLMMRTVRWGGNTYIMPSVRLQMQHYNDEFGSGREDGPLDTEYQPILGLVTITDGELGDGDQFAEWLEQQSGKVYATTVVLGFGHEHDRAVKQWKQIALRNPHVFVIEADGSTDANDLAAQVLARLR